MCWVNPLSILVTAHNPVSLFVGLKVKHGALQDLVHFQGTFLASVFRGPVTNPFSTIAIHRGPKRLEAANVGG